MRVVIPPATSKAAGVFGRLHGRPVDGVPRWVVLAAYGASLTVLPSCVWRIALGFGAPLGPLSSGAGEARGDVPSWVPLWVYAIILSVVSEALALLAVGLVSRWGEVFPRWIPVLGGRRVPTLAAVIPAGLGAAVLTVATLAWVPSFNTFTGPDGATLHLGGWKLAAFVAAYGPLLAWGPLLGIATVAYCLRRTRRRVSGVIGGTGQVGRDLGGDALAQPLSERVAEEGCAACGADLRGGTGGKRFGRLGVVIDHECSVRCS